VIYQAQSFQRTVLQQPDFASYYMAREEVTGEGSTYPSDICHKPLPIIRTVSQTRCLLALHHFICGWKKLS